MCVGRVGGWGRRSWEARQLWEYLFGGITEGLGSEIDQWRRDTYSSKGNRRQAVKEGRKRRDGEEERRKKRRRGGRRGEKMKRGR